MKIARFSYPSTGTTPAIAYGVVDDDALVVLSGDPLFSGFDTTGERVPLTEATLLAPVIPRSKVLCVGKNYRDHAAEMGGDAPDAPLLFLKPNTSVIGPGDLIVLPPQSQNVHFEGELAVVIGKVAKNLTEADAPGAVFGYTVANDVTARDLQNLDGQWTRAKGFDTFCPLGPFMETDLDTAALSLQTRVNGVVKQDGSTADLVHSVATIVAYASQAMTLLPGDVILTGTPAGVGPIVDGDTVEVEIAGIGVLSNPVRRR